MVIELKKKINIHLKCMYQNLICFIPSSQSNCQETDLLIISLRPMSCPDVLSTQSANSVLSQSKDKLSRWLSKSTNLSYNCCCNTAAAAANVAFSICTLKNYFITIIFVQCYTIIWLLKYSYFELCTRFHFPSSCVCTIKTLSFWFTSNNRLLI